MLEEIARNIRIHESLMVIARNKAKTFKEPTKSFYWLGVWKAEEKIVEDLKKLQEIAEMDVSSIDHCLDALRGL